VIGSERELDQIAEYADASVRSLQRPGSLLAPPGRHGFSEWLYARWGNRGNAVYTFVGCLLTVAFAALLAWAFDEPLIFPSLGPTAYLFFETPMAEAASPRNTIIGHGVAVLSALLALVAFGVLDADSAFEAGVTPARAGAIALSVALTGGLLRLLRAAHPPALATTVIVSSGLLTQAPELASIAGGVLIVTAASVALNRVLGVPAPVWTVPR
jgi:CBS domain-containing membrane protein